MGTNAGGSQQGSTPPKSVRELFTKNLNDTWKYYNEAARIQRQFMGRVAPNGPYKDEASARVACRQDFGWRAAVEDQQFTERLANLYGLATLIATADAILEAVSKPKVSLDPNYVDRFFDP
jgi:hypothetical protein